MSKHCILNMKTGALFGNLFDAAGVHELTILRRLNFTDLDLLTVGSTYVNRGNATRDFLWEHWRITSWTQLWGSNGLVFKKAKIALEWSVEQAIEEIKEVIRLREKEKLYHADQDQNHDHMLSIIRQTHAALKILLRKKKKCLSSVFCDAICDSMERSACVYAGSWLSKFANCELI